LPDLSAAVPVVLTLHDSWLLSGHCSHSIDCERWRIGCGQCPDLTLYPAIRRDATAYNWRRKRDIYRRSRLYVATPCRWLMDRVEQSMLVDGTVETRVIPNGVDLGVFQPAEQQAARARLALPPAAKVLLFAANQWIRESRAKDYGTLRAAVSHVGDCLQDQTVILLALGENAPSEHTGRVEIRFVPFQTDPRIVAAHYQAADLYVHSAHADTFPTTVLEALACGTPVVATAVCGIPEQLNGWAAEASSDRWNQHSLNVATGILVPPTDAPALGSAIRRVLENESVRHRLSENARNDAESRFDLQKHLDTYFTWYEEILERCRTTEPGANRHS
jgi:glycosyltransferase involved in cell wall biosynthesis